MRATIAAWIFDNVPLLACIQIQPWVFGLIIGRRPRRPKTKDSDE